MQPCCFTLLPDLPVSVDDVLRGRQRRKSHRTSRVEFLGTNPDLSSESEFEAVGESCGRIDVDSCRIHLIQEFLGILVILRDDRLGVTGIVVVDVGDRLVHGIHDLAGKDIVQVLFPPVFLRRRRKFRYDPN